MILNPPPRPSPSRNLSHEAPPAEPEADPPRFNALETPAWSFASPGEAQVFGNWTLPLIGPPEPAPDHATASPASDPVAPPRVEDAPPLEPPPPVPPLWLDPLTPPPAIPAAPLLPHPDAQALEQQFLASLAVLDAMLAAGTIPDPLTAWIAPPLPPLLAGITL